MKRVATLPGRERLFRVAGRTPLHHPQPSPPNPLFPSARLRTSLAGRGGREILRGDTPRSPWPFGKAQGRRPGCRPSVLPAGGRTKCGHPLKAEQIRKRLLNKSVGRPVETIDLPFGVAQDMLLDPSASSLRRRVAWATGQASSKNGGMTLSCRSSLALCSTLPRRPRICGRSRI